MQRLGDTTTLVIKLDRQLKERLQRATDGGEMSKVIRELIETWLADREPKYRRTNERATDTSGNRKRSRVDRRTRKAG